MDMEDKKLSFWVVHFMRGEKILPENKNRLKNVPFVEL